jgi:hydrogenase maturation protein HypF
MQSYEFTISGLVQGIGYRPFVAEMLSKEGFKGYVQNTGGIVKIYLNLDKGAVPVMVHRLYSNFPEGAQVEKITVEKIPFVEFEDFYIESSGQNNAIPLLPTDLTICENCRRELLDRGNRRYFYPFISCAACGPRYTIMKRTPYDRENTTQSVYDLCDNCRKEYLSPGNRRHYAQTISCPDCGPQLKLNYNGEFFLKNQALELAIALLKKGEALAVKDVGGYHLVCDATNEAAVRKIRLLKKRENKPFAVMFPDAEAVKSITTINNEDEKLLKSNARPIVLLEMSDELKLDRFLAPSVNLSSPYLGAMLPSNGLQVLLLQSFEALVMTSANISGEPIITDDEEIKTLGTQNILYNDRQILTPVDDSIVRVVNGKPSILRRARGYVPEPIELTALKINDNLNETNSEVIFAAGADMKASFGFLAGKRAFLSQGFGDFAYERVKKEYNLANTKLQDNFGFKPQLFVIDRHPGYISRKNLAKLAEKNKKELKIYEAYHHEAHAASVMAEHGLFDEPCVSFIFDGTGYGRNGSIWGGEVFIGALGRFKRVGHLNEVKLSAGDEASKNAGMSFAAFLDDADMAEKILAVNNFDFNFSMYQIVRKAIEADLNTIPSSSMGRLFDAVSFLLGICSQNGYEGQCPCELEYKAVLYANQTCNYKANASQLSVDSVLSEHSQKIKSNNSYLDNWLSEAWKTSDGNRLRIRNVFLDNEFYADTRLFIKELAARYLELIFKSDKKEESLSKTRACLAYEFHLALAEWMVEIADYIFEEYAANQAGEKKIILGGGTFANRLLLKLACEKLEEKGCTVYYNEQVPPGDEGITLGQLALAAAIKKE